MTAAVARLALVLASALALVGVDAAAKPGKSAKPKKVPWTLPIPSEVLPLQIDRTAQRLICLRNKECTITGRFGANSKLLFALDGDDGKRRFALIGAKGWNAQSLAVKVPGTVPANTFHRLTIVDAKGRATSNSVRVFVGTSSSCALDEDGDGYEAIACGGDDCDDQDANRYNGNIEVCDNDNHDEDCDPHTFGYRDGDGDGHPDALCCNSDGERLWCGDDCDDAQPSVHPDQPDACNRVDDDCNGYIDDVTRVKVYRDADADLYGNPAETQQVCIQDIPSGWVLDNRDCKDNDANKNPRQGCG
ncbi:MAG TPA: putative metal-binding motif-containing protein [Nannocystaceae bacterium]|nr:putative metal-binding motif-containing protein [Nannocystaceae bacterium]